MHIVCIIMYRCVLIFYTWYCNMSLHISTTKTMVLLLRQLICFMFVSRYVDYSILKSIVNWTMQNSYKVHSQVFVKWHNCQSVFFALYLNGYCSAVVMSYLVRVLFIICNRLITGDELCYVDFYNCLCLSCS